MDAYFYFRAIREEHLVANKEINLYILLDHAGLPGLHSKLVKSSAQWASLFEDSKERNALSVAPILVRIGGNGQLEILPSLFAWINEHGTYSSTIIILASALDIDSLKRRLARRLEVKLSENMDAMLRYFDPRIFEQLVHSLSVDQARTFFSPAERWWYLDRAGKIRSVLSEFRANEEYEPQLTLSATQEFELVDASEADQILALIRENAPELVAKMPGLNQYEFAIDAVIAGKSIGLSSTAEFAVYCAVTISKGREFVNSPVWREVIDDVNFGHRGFLDAVVVSGL